MPSPLKSSRATLVAFALVVAGCSSASIGQLGADAITADATSAKDAGPAPDSGPPPALDKYGGEVGHACAGGALGYFYLHKDAGRWHFCDPLGNVFVSMSVSAVNMNPNPTDDCSGANTYDIYTRKYGNTNTAYNWGWEALRRITSWGFNSIGQDSVSHVEPFDTCSSCNWPNKMQPIPLPYLTEMKPAENASVNREGYIAEPIKDIMSGTNDNYTGWRGAALFDVFDPKLGQEFQKELQASGTSVQNIRNNYPWLLGVFTDDSDYFWGSGAGPDFPSGHTAANVAWMTLISSPVQTYIESTGFIHKTFVYQDSKNYSKANVLNPSTQCSSSNPCSLRDYLWQKYGGSISALNQAWGSNYTTFDSSGTQVRGETVGTGDGSTRVFTHTLAHISISPLSVLVSVSGAAQAGDCPWFHAHCTASSGTGSVGSPTPGFIDESASQIDYGTGKLTITFATAPASGAAIKVDYIYGGWMAGGTGLMDESGGTAWVGTNPYCLEGPDPNYTTYFSCVGGGGVWNPKPDANAALGADLDAWVSQFAAKYFKVMHDDLKAVSKVPYLGLDVIGSYGIPAYSKFLEGAAPYIDGAFVGGLATWRYSSTAALQSGYQYLTRYIGDLPLLDFIVDVAQADSSMSCYTSGSHSFKTQAERGQGWYDTVNDLLNGPGYNGTYPFVGFDWWAYRDFQKLNMGLVSIHDNAYDGKEAIIAPGTDPWGLSTGGESTNYGDCITPVSQANRLWWR